MVIGVLLIVIACCRIVSDIYNDYKIGYELCVEYRYVWPVDCSSTITFEQYKQSFSIIEAIRSGYVSVLDKFVMSHSTFLLSLGVCLLIFAKPFKKREQKENIENLFSENNLTINESDIIRPNPLKLIIGLIPFILILIHSIVQSSKGFAFLGPTVYGLKAFVMTFLFDIIIFSGIIIIFVALIIDYIKDVCKMNK